MAVTASDVLQRSKDVRVLSVFCDDVVAALRDIQFAAEEQQPAPSVITLSWAAAPSLATELYEIQEALADAALALWPVWYTTAEQRFSCGSESVDCGVISEVAASITGASTGWLAKAWWLCRSGKPPVVEGMASAEQVRQLALAIDPARLICLLCVDSPRASTARMRGLARAAEWVAGEARARTVLVVPSAWTTHPELDRVSYGAVHIQAEPVASPLVVEHGRDVVSASKPGPAVFIEPLFGKPHPASEAEKLVHGRIVLDPELSSLFQYNQPLTGFEGRRYRVDLVWELGGLVIELDGAEHRTPNAYIKDRERDYRLTMSGYTILRVPNEQVYVDLDAVIEKIRNMVRMIEARKSSEEHIL